jgi:hypothetical protein
VEGLLGFIPDDLKDAKDAPFVSGMPPFLGMIVSDLPPGILRGAPRHEKWTGHLYAVAPSDYNERTMATLGDSGPYRFGFRVHPSILGQVAAKTAHAFAVASLGLGGFTPFLADYIRAHKPPFDGYHIALLPNMTESEALHEISIRLERALQITVLGTAYHKVYVVRVRFFARLLAPEFIVVVGKPVSI